MMFDTLKKIQLIIKEIVQLPKVKIHFTNYDDKSLENYRIVYNYFTKIHRFKLFKNKELGVALIDFSKFNSIEEYYQTINGKNSAAYYARKALKREYSFVEIDRNDYIGDLYEINISAPIRQGQKMKQSYLEKQNYFIDYANYRYFGVIDKDKKLVAYCNIGFYGEFASIDTLLGHKQYLNDGIMYFMISEVHSLVFEEYQQKGVRYMMYDTFFGASEGLKKFKTKLGYKPYKVKWLWEI